LNRSGAIRRAGIRYRHPAVAVVAGPQPVDIKLKGYPQRCAQKHNQFRRV